MLLTLFTFEKIIYYAYKYDLRKKTNKFLIDFY